MEQQIRCIHCQSVITGNAFDAGVSHETGPQSVSTLSKELDDTTRSSLRSGSASTSSSLKGVAADVGEGKVASMRSGQGNGRSMKKEAKMASPVSMTSLSSSDSSPSFSSPSDVATPGDDTPSSLNDYMRWHKHQEQTKRGVIVARRKSTGQVASTMDESFIVLNNNSKAIHDLRHEKKAKSHPKRPSGWVRTKKGLTWQGNTYDQAALNQRLLGYAYSGVLGKGDHPEIGMVAKITGEDDLDASVQESDDEEFEDLTHSLCTDCFEYVQNFLRHEYIEVQYRKNEMTFVLNELTKQEQAEYGSSRNRNTSAVRDLLAEKAESLLYRQKELVTKMNELQTQRERVHCRWDALMNDEQALEREELQFFMNSRAIRTHMLPFVEERDSLCCRIQRAQQAIKRLSPMNAFIDAFKIWREGSYGVINDFRLGKLMKPEKVGNPETRNTDRGAVYRPPPEWTEVNTAWGMSAMLLCAIAQSVHFKFEHFKIIPLGAHSIVQSLAASKTFSLYYDEERTGRMENLITGLIGSTPRVIESFNIAMGAFVVCMYELMNFAMETPTGKACDLKRQLYPVTVPDSLVSGSSSSSSSSSSFVNTKHSWSSKNSTSGGNNSLSSSMLASSSKEANFLEIVAKCTVNRNTIEMTSPYSCPEVAKRPAHAAKWTNTLYCILSNLKWLLVWVIHTKREEHASFAHF